MVGTLEDVDVISQCAGVSVVSFNGEHDLLTSQLTSERTRPGPSAKPPSQKAAVLVPRGHTLRLGVVPYPHVIPLSCITRSRESVSPERSRRASCACRRPSAS